MSPFFRGSVRPVKKHPRPWSTNPRLNPDLGKDNTHLSILGLPIQETDVTLPVFNNIYRRPSLDDIRKPVVDAPNGYSRPEPITEETTSEEVHEAVIGETDRPAPVAALAETTDSPEPVGHAAPSTTNTDASQTEPAVVASSEAHDVEREPAVDVPAQENVKDTISSEPLPSSTASATLENWPFQADITTTNGFIGKDSSEDRFVERAGPETTTADETVPVVETAETAENAETEPVGTDAVPAEVSSVETETEQHHDGAEAPSSDVVSSAAGYESAPQSLPTETLATISEEAPAAENEGPEASTEHVEAREKYALSGLEVIKEEDPPVATEEAAASGTEPVAAEDPAHRDEKPENPADHSAPESAQSPASIQTKTSLRGDTPPATEELRAATPRTPAVDHMPTVAEDTAEDEPEHDQSPGDTPSIPRHSQVAPPAGEYTTRSNRDSIAVSSVEGSVGMNEEPLVTDEQLEVSDEFKPGMRMYPVEAPH